MPEFTKFLQNFLKISRANIQVASLPHALLGVVLGATGFSAILTWPVLAYIILVFAMITFACNLNCLYDLDVDRKYKTYMSNAVESIDIGNVKRIILLELLIISLLLYILLASGYLATVLLSILGILLIIAYSAEPLRLKKRGILSPIPVFLGLYTLPVLGGWFIVATGLPLYFMVFFVGYALMNEGITLVNTCEDYSEDMESGIRTWAHGFGLKRTMAVAFLLTLSGGMGMVASLLFMLTFAEFGLAWAVSLALILLSAGTALKTSIDIYMAGKADDLEASAKGHARRMPRWFMSTRYPILLAAMFTLLA